MKMTAFVCVLTALILTSVVPPADAYQAPRRAQETARRYSRMAGEMLSSGRTTDGIKLLRLASKTDPYNPIYRMEYVRIMSKVGEHRLQEGNRREAILVFKSVEGELLSAAKLFKDAGDAGNAAHALMQVSQICRYVYRNEGLAQGYAQKALELNPDLQPLA